MEQTTQLNSLTEGQLDQYNCYYAIVNVFHVRYFSATSGICQCYSELINSSHLQSENNVRVVNYLCLAEKRQ